jgi:uncharacterized Tic20 family protein
MPGAEGEAMQQDPNPGGRQEEPATSRVGAQTMSPQDEKTWSMLAHLSVLLAFVSLIPFGALLIWLIYKDRSPKVRFHALQALWYQIACVVLFILYALVTVILSIVTFGIAAIVLVPLGLVVAVAPVIYGCYAAYQVSQGVEFRYPYLADKIEGPRGVV